jgi:hypothetical protein
MKKINLILMVLFLIPSVCVAEDNFYSVSYNTVISDNYKIILDNNVKSDLFIDNNNLYFYTSNNFYIVNKTSGNINYKLSISDIKNQAQSDNYSYLQTDYNIYKINKSSGNIEEKRIYINLLKDIYSLFGVSGISGTTIINNYYICGNCTNGTNGLNGSNGVNGSNGLNGIDGLNGLNGTNGINQSDDTKVNKSGDTLTGDLYFDTNIMELYGKNYKSFVEFLYDNISNYGTLHLYSSNTIYEQNILMSENDINIQSDNTGTGNASYISLDENNIQLSSNNINFNNDINLSGNNISNCGNCVSIDNGSYVGDGTTNRFIPYNFNKSKNNIDIVGNSNSPMIGKIINNLGYIYSNTIYSNINRVIVTPPTTSGFYVTGIYNIGSFDNITEFYNSTANSAGWNSKAMYTPFLSTNTGNLINLTINLSSASGNVMIALYSDNVGSIGTLLTNSSIMVANNGHNTFSLSYPVTQENQYWIGIELSSSTTEISRNTTYTGSYYNSHTFGSFTSNPTGLTAYAARFTTTIEISITSIEYFWFATG